MEMEATAMRNHLLAGDAVHFQQPQHHPGADFVGSTTFGGFDYSQGAATSSRPLPPPPPPPPPPEKLREPKRCRKDRKRGNDDDPSDDDADAVPLRKKRKHRSPPEPGVGHYSEEEEEEAGAVLKEEDGVDRVNDDGDSNGPATLIRRSRVWLEGHVFGGGILEPDLPIQLWTGPLLTPPPEGRRLPEHKHHWTDALVAAVHRRRQQRHQREKPLSPSVVSSAAIHDEESDDEDDCSDMVVTADVSYLEYPDASDETLVREVPLNRIRILLGDSRDDRIPDNLEEARILAVGGAEEEVTTELSPTAAAAATVVDEATGFSGWTTVAVKKTTARLELKEERARLATQRREAAVEAARQVKLAEARKMEESRVANADDSALGAYDVWNRGAKEGYKGVDIHGEVPVEAHELGKKLATATEGTVAFKKPAFKAKNRSQNRRKTSSED